MAYLHDHYSFPSEHYPPPIYAQPLPFAYQQQAHPLDHFYPGYAPAEYTEFPHGVMQDDLEEGGEVSTRPRLTKEQVEVLETQFKAHPKPNSNTKRQLAVQTKLTLPRVSNWFQNRRAKAKQQRKQEEFEVTQRLGPSKGWKSEDDVSQIPVDARADITAAGQSPASPGSAAEHADAARSTSTLGGGSDPAKEASWASLQRALNTARVARMRQDQEQQQAVSTMPPPDPPRQSISQSLSIPMKHSMSQQSTSSLTDWTGTGGGSGDWTTPSLSNPIPFDFGFDQPPSGAVHMEDSFMGPSSGSLHSQNYAIPVDEWREPIQTPTFPRRQGSELASIDQSPAMHLQAYSTSRRPSTSDELAANLGNFALAGTPPTRLAMPPASGEDVSRRFEGDLDLAARRNRPRPAAIGGAALRSRSFGALNSMSPTTRPGSTLPHTIRHVKSVGPSLNARFAGIRKPSSAQRSPLTISTFAEAEAFNQLMAQNASATQAQRSVSQSGTTTPFLSPEMSNTSQMPIRQNSVSPAQSYDILGQFPFQTMHQLDPSMTSPPVTPFKADFIMPPQVQNMIPSVSAPYATFPEYTPPYSAGPLSSGSWSDAPMPSPDLTSFAPVPHLSSLSFPQHSDMMMPHFQHFMMPAEPLMDGNIVNSSEPKKTEFFIQEFPGQKEEHAHVAQQLAQQQPKSYVFANATPNDFEGPH